MQMLCFDNDCVKGSMKNYEIACYGGWLVSLKLNKETPDERTITAAFKAAL